MNKALVKADTYVNALLGDAELRFGACSETFDHLEAILTAIEQSESPEQIKKLARAGRYMADDYATQSCTWKEEAQAAYKMKKAEAQP